NFTQSARSRKLSQLISHRGTFSVGWKSVPASYLKRLMIVELVFWLAIFAAPHSAKAQATGGSISGTVTREAGGTMPGARVSLADQARTVSREVTSDTDG